MQWTAEEAKNLWDVSREKWRENLLRTYKNSALAVRARSLYFESSNLRSELKSVYCRFMGFVIAVTCLTQMLMKFAFWPGRISKNSAYTQIFILSALTESTFRLHLYCGAPHFMSFIFHDCEWSSSVLATRSSHQTTNQSINPIYSAVSLKLIILMHHNHHVDEVAPVSCSNPRSGNSYEGNILKSDTWHRLNWHMCPVEIFTYLLVFSPTTTFIWASSSRGEHQQASELPSSSQRPSG